MVESSTGMGGMMEEGQDQTHTLKTGLDSNDLTVGTIWLICQFFCLALTLVLGNLFTQIVAFLGLLSFFLFMASVIKNRKHE